MNETKFTRGAWVWLLLVIFVLVGGIGGMLYFFTLPTDGWLAMPEGDYGNKNLIYLDNIVGTPSALQSGDTVVAIEGIPLATRGMSALQDRWHVGETLRYSIIRNGTTREVTVPLAGWQIGPALSYWVSQSGSVGYIGIFILFAIAALAFFKRPEDHAARALFWFAAMFPTQSVFLQTVQSSANIAVFPTYSVLSELNIFIAYSIAFPPALLQFALVFPRPKPIVLRHPWLEYLPYLIGLVFVLPLFILGNYIQGYLWTIFSVIGTILLVLHSALTMRDALSRAQLTWGLWGFVLGMGMFLTTFFVIFNVVSGFGAALFNALYSLSFSVLGITLAIAILRYRLFDIGILIRRTLTYAFVTIPLALIYFGSIVVLQRLFSALTGSGQNEIVTVLSTLAIAALFIPVRNRIQTLIDKRFNRNKYNAQQVLTDFANTVRDETDLEKLTARLMQVVDETMQPKTVSVWLKKDSK